MSKLHADASPSSSDIWLNCPASVTKARGRTRKSTIYTREGTALHEAAEAVLRFGQMPTEVEVEGETFEIDAERQDLVMTYVNYVNTFDNLHIETKVQISVEGEDIFGTVDAYDVQDLYAEVCDFKAGAGHLVSPDANQLRIYGLGVLNDIGPSNISEMVLTVVQPRVNPDPQSVTISVADLLEWEDKTLKPAVDKLIAGDTTETPGDWCRWCVRAHECQALAVIAQESAKVAFAPDAESLSNDELASILDKAELIAGWVAKVRAEASFRAEAGQSIPGWKLVPKRASRKWESPDAAIIAMKGMKIPVADVTRIETLTNVEKVLKLRGVRDPKAFTEPFVSKTSSGSTLVSEADPRISIDTSPRSVFQIEFDETN